MPRSCRLIVRYTYTETCAIHRYGQHILLNVGDCSDDACDEIQNLPDVAMPGPVSWRTDKPCVSWHARVAGYSDVRTRDVVNQQTAYVVPYVTCRIGEIDG